MRVQVNSGVPHPIPYQGSKRACASEIMAYFPGDADRLIEPFAGSAAVALATAHHRRAQRFLINDINQALIKLWDEIINRPEAIANAYEKLWQAQLGQERGFYDLVRSKFNHTQRPDYFLYLLARCVKASVRYNPNGEFNQSPDNRRKGARPDAMRDRILRASLLLKGKTGLSCLDYRDLLLDATPSDIVYMDPPYRGVCSGKDRRYRGSLSFDADAFVGMLRVLNDKGVSFIVSYDGRTGEKTFGSKLPEFLGLKRLEINVGRSSQATLLGRNANTVESLYLSPALIGRIGEVAVPKHGNYRYQQPLFADAV